MKTITILTTILIISIKSLLGQSICFEEAFSHNSHANKFSASVTRTNNNSYVSLGENDIIKVDQSGNKIWSKTFAGDGKWVEGVGTSLMFCGNRNGDIYVEKRDQTGSLTWNKSYGSQNYNEYGYSIRGTHDQGYIIAGYIDSLNSVNAMYLLKLDSAGNKLWDRSYEYGMDEKGFSLQVTTDSGFIVIGHSEFSNTEFSTIFKTDQNGNMDWSTVMFGACRDIIQCTDGSYIATGEKAQNTGIYNDLYILKLNTNGQTQWEKEIGAYALDEIGNSIIETNDGGYAIGGTRREQQGQSSFFYEMAMLTKIDTAGNLIWQNLFGSNSNETSGYDVEQCQDEGFVLTGAQRGFSQNMFDLYIVKTNNIGIVDSNVITGIEEQIRDIESTLYPNPANHEFIISMSDGSPILSVIIYDHSGRIIRQENGNGSTELTIQRKDIKPGHYIVEATSKNGTSPSSILFR